MLKVCKDSQLTSVVLVSTSAILDFGEGELAEDEKEEKLVLLIGSEFQTRMISRPRTTPQK